MAPEADNIETTIVHVPEQFIRQVEHALVAEPSTKPKPGFIKPAPVEKVIYDTKSECGQLREMLKAHVTEFHDYVKQQQSQGQARNGKRKWNQNGSKGQGDGKDKKKENQGGNKQPSNLAPSTLLDLRSRGGSVTGGRPQVVLKSLRNPQAARKNMGALLFVDMILMMIVWMQTDLSHQELKVSRSPMDPTLP